MASRGAPMFLCLLFLSAQAIFDYNMGVTWIYYYRLSIRIQYWLVNVTLILK